MVRSMVRHLDAHCPGVKQELLRDEPQVDNLLLQSVAKLRAEAVEAGFQSIAVQDLDWTMSNEGTWPRNFLKKQGYAVGKPAWKAVIKRVKQTSTLSWHARERALQAGRPCLATEAVLRAAEKILSKPPNLEVKWRKCANMRMAPAAAPTREVLEPDQVAVPAQPLLVKPFQLWKQNKVPNESMSKQTFYILLKERFANYRLGHRDTDICSHCRCY